MGRQRGTTHLQPSLCLDGYVFIHFWFYMRITRKLRKETTRQSASNEWKGIEIYLVSFDLKYYNYIICSQSIVFLLYLVFVVAIPTWSMTLCRNCLSQFSSSFSIPSPAILQSHHYIKLARSLTLPKNLSCEKNYSHIAFPCHVSEFAANRDIFRSI